MNNLYSVNSYVSIIEIFQVLFSTTAFPPYSLKSNVALARDPFSHYITVSYHFRDLTIQFTNKNIHGIVVEEEEMKLELFAVDLTVFKGITSHL